MLNKEPLLSQLKPELQNIWKKSGFTEPTAIQTKAIPLILQGKDLIAESPTGTGKTVAYLLPILEQIDEKAKGVRLSF